MRKDADGTVHYESYSGYMNAMRRDWKHEDAEREGKKSKYEGLRHYIGANDRWSAVLYPPPGQIGITEPHFVSSSLRSPLIIMHNFSCEVEAALARDFVELWWRLNQDGWTPAKLAVVRWNLPQLRLWDDPGVVKSLRSIGLNDPKRAQTRCRMLAHTWLPRLPRGLLSAKDQERVDQEEAERQRRADETKAKAWQEAAAMWQWLQGLSSASLPAQQPQLQPAARPRAVKRKEREVTKQDRAEAEQEERERAAAKAAAQAQERAQRAARREAQVAGVQRAARREALR